MINIVDKVDCVGCGACYDVCGHQAISFIADIEGFSYPQVDRNKCTDCGLCEKVCPVINVASLKEQQSKLPKVYSAYFNDKSRRVESTSGGIFSALAIQWYENEGYVGGAVYSEDYSIKHIISNDGNDLQHIRGSKHAQSQMLGYFKQVKRLLLANEKVLVCAAPCQIAGLRLFLGKDYENLATIDFLCLGINSPKVFEKYIKYLEESYNGHVISIQAKNKDLGWRSLAYKVQFDNGMTYLKKGTEDIFTRGFIKTHCNSRPACYDCKFKGYPRISDISLGDFWGIDRVDKSMDDNLGTSVVLVNSEKGNTLFEAIKRALTWKEQSLYDVLPGNLALVKSITLPTIDRYQYYKDLDEMRFGDFALKYYQVTKRNYWKSFLKRIRMLYYTCGINPLTYWKLLQINCLRSNTIHSSIMNKRLIIPTPHSVLCFDKTAILDINGIFLFGAKRIKGSALESRLCVEGDGELIIRKGGISTSYGCDFLVFNNAKLVFTGNADINQNVQIICMDYIEIGNDVMISRDVVIRDNDGGHEIMSKGYKKTAPVIIGNHVWIGQGAMIMKGVTIGDGAIIGAGAWVATNVKPRSVVMTDPSRTVQKDMDWIR